MSAARFVLRRASTTAASRFCAVPKATPRSAFQMPKQSPLSRQIFRSPVELSCCVETMLPYHTATASALLNSNLSVSCRAWLVQDDDS